MKEKRSPVASKCCKLSFSFPPVFSFNTLLTVFIAGVTNMVPADQQLTPKDHMSSLQAQLDVSKIQFTQPC